MVVAGIDWSEVAGAGAGAGVGVVGKGVIVNVIDVAIEKRQQLLERLFSARDVPGETGGVEVRDECR